MKKILIFELNWLGDILFSFPLMKVLKRDFPGAYISCAVVSRYAQLLEGQKCVDEVLILPEKGNFRSFLEWPLFIRSVRKKGFDVCFFLKPSRSRSMAAANVGTRIGFEGKNVGLTHAVRAEEGDLHRMDRILSLAEAAGAKVAHRDRVYEYVLSNSELDRARNLLRSCGHHAPGRIVCVNPGGNWAPKRWPAGDHAELIGLMLEKYGDISIAVTGAPKDRALALRIAASAGDPRCFSIAGRTDLKGLAAVFALSSLVISADSGPLHLAAACGVPVVGLFGPTSPALTGPRGTNASSVIHHEVGCNVPCYETDCSKGFECMKSIRPSEVMKRVSELLEKCKRETGDV
jgi:lipopolysaccharide heptosyltransferase II